MIKIPENWIEFSVLVELRAVRVVTQGDSHRNTLEKSLPLTCSKFSTRKLDKGLCLSRTKSCAGCDSRGFEPATPVAGPATLKYCLKVWPGEPGVPQTSKPCEALRTLKNHTT